MTTHTNILGNGRRRKLLCKNKSAAYEDVAQLLRANVSCRNGRAGAYTNRHDINPR